MEKRKKIRDWEAKRDDLNDKLDFCEEKLRNQEQDQRPDGFKDRLATAKVRDDCSNTYFFIIFRMLNLFNWDFGCDNCVSHHKDNERPRENQKKITITL